MSLKFLSSAKVRCVQAAVLLVMGGTLVACGGGGSGNQVVDKVGTPLFTSSAPKMTVAPGVTTEFTIGGGGGGSSFTSYTVSSSNPAVAKATVQGTKLIVTGIANGTANLNVADSAGANISIEVTVRSATATGSGTLAVNAPSSVTLDPGMSVQYKVTGGTGQYTAVSSSPTIASVGVSAGMLSVTAANPGNATIVVFDASGSSSKFDLAVTAGSAGAKIPLYSTAPESLRMQVGSALIYAVRGGVAPYTASSSNPAAITSSVNGEILTLSALTGGASVIRIRDALGAATTVSASVESSSPVDLYTTAPSSLSIPVGVAPSYAINGGTGPYSASTSNAGVAKATVSGGNLLNITGVATGVATVVVFDSTGKSVPVAVSVSGGTGNVPLYTTAPDAITISVGAAPTYTIAGGAGPYVVTSSDVAVVSVTQSGNTFTATGLKAGMATIAVRDANGSPVNISVTVP